VQQCPGVRYFCQMSRPNLASIAVVRTDRLGDMVLTLPLLGALRRALPDARLSLITRSYVEPLLFECPVVDRAVFADRLRGGVAGARTEIRPDAVFFPRPVLSEAFAAFALRIPLRAGSLYRAYSPLYSHKIPEHRSDARFHEAEYNVRMAKFVLERLLPGRFPDDMFVPELVRPVVQPAAATSVREILHAAGIDSRQRFAVIHPGSGGSSPVWPAANFADVAARFSAATGIPTVITGTAPETALCEFVAERSHPAVNLSGRLSLAEMIALLDVASIMIANATGTLHVAAALGTPAVGLFPNSPAISPKRWRPFSENSTAITPPAGDRMELIGVEEVITAALKMLG
jgi:ADP-heptose:LPS heptosyltransferase